MKYSFIESNIGRYSIEMMSRILSVSPRSYYNYKRDKYTARAERKKYLLLMNQVLYFKAKCRNFFSRITGDIRAKDILKSNTLVVVYIHKLGIRSRIG